MQVQALLEDLIQAQEALDRAPVNERLRNRLSIDVDDAFREPREKLEGIERDLAGECVLADCWKRYRTERKRLSSLLVQCLALIHGSLARDNQLAVDVCEVADALLDDVSARTPVKWGRFTILAEGEFLGEVAEIVRLRFPEVSLWSLPIAAHEFGHFIAPRLRVDDEGARSPFAQMLAEAPDPNAMGRTYEHIADVFATYTVGPCFPIACVLLRFDPDATDDPWSDHPSDARRFAAMLHVLGRLDGTTGDYAEISDRLRELWPTAGAAAPAPTDEIDVIFDQLDVLLPAGAAYRGWHRVDELARTLADERLPLPRGSSVAPWDVVNAAWWCRVEYFGGDVYDVRDLGERALALCRETLVHAGRLPAE
jgi:hypothetical protein